MSLEPLTRRHFLRTGTAAVLGLAALPSAHAADNIKDDPFGGFTLGIQSYTYRKFNVEQTLKRTKELGLHYIEFFRGQVPLESSPEQIKALLSLCKEYDITPNAYGVEPFTKDHDANKKRFELAKALGIKSLSADPTPDSFDSLDRLVEEYKIAIAIHPHGPGHHWISAEVILAAVKDHHALIGTCLDTGHLLKVVIDGKRLDPAQQVRVMGARNFAMHLKDHDTDKKTDVVFGKGHLDVPAVLKALREVKFKGTISIEYEANPDDPTADVKGCVDVFKESVKKLA